MGLTPDDISRLHVFLQPSLIAVVATIGRDGVPQLTPNWYVLADGKISISTTKERFKYINLSHDNRLSICIYSEPQAEQYATLRGRAEISDDESIWPITRAIVERYVSPSGIEERMRKLHTENRVIINMKPDQVVFRT